MSEASPKRTPSPRGRPAAATRDAVVAAALRRYVRGERVDVRAVATELGLSRNTIHNWFGGREQLIGEVVLEAALPLLARCREKAGGAGGPALIETFDRYNRALSAAPALQAFVEHEREVAMRILTSRSGVVEPAMVAAIAALIEREVAAGAYEPPIEPDLLAYAIVRLAETFLFNEHSMAAPGELDRLRAVEAALLQV